MTLSKPMGGDETLPSDAYGPDYHVHCIREHFSELRRFVSHDIARAELAEILLEDGKEKRRYEQ